MNVDEFSRCIALVDGYWPHGGRSNTADDLELWESLLIDLDHMAVAAAIQTLATDGREWPPPPGLIRRRTLDLVDPLPTADDAWREVTKRISSVGMNERPEFTKPLIGQVVATMGWRNLCMSTQPMADRAHFLRMWGEAVTKQRTIDQMPPGAREALGGIMRSVERGGEPQPLSAGLSLGAS